MWDSHKGDTGMFFGLPECVKQIVAVHQTDCCWGGSIPRVSTKSLKFELGTLGNASARENHSNRN